MRTSLSSRFSPVLAVAALLGLAGASCLTAYGAARLWQESPSALAEAGDITASVAPVAAPENTKKDNVTGLPLPRFVTLKADKVNVRRGPSSDHAVAFIFQRKGMPVEITAEFENWRKIRDSDGAEGWILHSMLSGRRNAYVAQWGGALDLDLRTSPATSSGLEAKLSVGVLASIEACDGQWCEISAGSFDGYAEQSKLWGVYPGEVVD